MKPPLDEDHPALAKARVMAEYQEAELMRYQIVRAFADLAADRIEIPVAMRIDTRSSKLGNRAARRTQAAKDRKSKVQR